MVDKDEAGNASLEAPEGGSGASGIEGAGGSGSDVGGSTAGAGGGDQKAGVEQKAADVEPAAGAAGPGAAGPGAAGAPKGPEGGDPAAGAGKAGGARGAGQKPAEVSRLEDDLRWMQSVVGDVSEAIPDEVVRSITPDALASLPLEGRLAVKALVKQVLAVKGLLEARETAHREQVAAARKEIAEHSRRIAVQQRQMMGLLDTPEFRKKAGADTSSLDLNTPEGLQAFVEAHTAKSYEATLKPAREALERAERQSQWESFVRSEAPELMTPAIFAEYDAFLQERKGRGIPVEAQAGFYLFKATVLDRRARERSAATGHREVARSAAQVGRAAGTGAAATKIPRRLKDDTAGLLAALQSNPEYLHLINRLGIEAFE